MHGKLYNKILYIIENIVYLQEGKYSKINLTNT